jgi:hypothetical protein
MDDFEPIDMMMKRMKKKYDEDNENWRVLSNQDKDGNREMFIQHAPNTWWLKMRQINPVNYMSAGKEIRNLDDEITKQIGNPSIPNQEQDMLQLFGMMVPTKKDIIYTTGIERFSPQMAQDQVQKIEEKNPDLEREFRLHLRRKWAKEQAEKENLYL